MSYLSVKAATDIQTFPDLIWDAHWLYSEEDLPKYIAIATAHNAVWWWDWESNTKQLIAECEEPCILYLCLPKMNYRIYSNKRPTLN